MFQSSLLCFQSSSLQICPINDNMSPSNSWVQTVGSWSRNTQVTENQYWQRNPTWDPFKFWFHRIPCACVSYHWYGLIFMINLVWSISDNTYCNLLIPPIWIFWRLLIPILFRSEAFNDSNLDHEMLLLQLWTLLQPDTPLLKRVTKQWQTIGIHFHIHNYISHMIKSIQYWTSALISNVISFHSIIWVL